MQDDSYMSEFTFAAISGPDYSILAFIHAIFHVVVSSIVPTGTRLPHDGMIVTEGTAVPWQRFHTGKDGIMVLQS